MLGIQNALDFIIKMQGIEVSIDHKEDANTHVVIAAQSNYFRKPLLDENMTSDGRSYVVSSRGLTIVPARGDVFAITQDEYYSIADAQEMRALGTIIGYRLFLE